MSRKIKVPAERRIAAPVPPRVTVSSNKYLTCTDAFDEMGDQATFSGLLLPLDLSVSDSFTLTDFHVLVADMLVVIEQITPIMFDDIAVSDRLAVSDSITELVDSLTGLGYGHAFSDSFTLTDALLVAANNALALSDSSAQSDSLAIGYGVASSDSFALTDALTKFAQIFLIINDAGFQWDDFITPVPQGVQFTISSSDVFSQTDAVQLFAAGFRAFGDLISLTDAYAQRATGFLTFSDSLSSQSDALVKILGLRLNLSENMGTLADNVAGSGSIWDITVTSQQTTQTDAATTFITNISSGLSLSDSLGAMGDAVVTKKPRWRDSISLSAVQTRRWRDAVSLNLGTPFQALSRTGSDQIVLTDAPVTLARVQWAAPIADVSVGLWSATPLWQKVDESAFSDADFIVSATNPSNDTCELTLQVMTDPVSSVNHILSYRYGKSASGGRQINLTVSLRQGTGTQIAAWTHTNISDVVTTANQTLTGPQADAITNYADLRVRLVAVFVGSGTGRAARVHWVQFRAPK